MSGNYFGEPNLGSNERGGGSSRKSKKINSNKPKQPQRGLGVAELEKIRLQGQIGSYHYPSLHPAYPSNFNQDDITMQTAYSSLPSSSCAYASSSSASSASYNFHPNLVEGLGDYERTDIRYGDSKTFATASYWNPGNSILEVQHFGQPRPTQHLPNPQVEETQRKKKKHHYQSLLGSSTQNSESGDTQEEVDLELKLSI